MTPPEIRESIIRLDELAGRARLALHAIDDAPDAAGRVIAATALKATIRRASTVAYELDVELRAIALLG